MPTFIVMIYGIFLLSLIVIICLLLKEDLSKLQAFMSQTLKTDRLNLNFSDFDDHFNFYVSQSLNYLRDNTNMTLPVSDPSTNKTTIVDLAQYVRTVVSEPVIQGEDEMSLWNATLLRNSQYLEGYDHFLCHRHLLLDGF